MIKLDINRENLKEFACSGSLATILGEFMLSILSVGIDIGIDDEIFDMMIGLMQDAEGRKLAMQTAKQMAKCATVYTFAMPKGDDDE